MKILKIIAFLFFSFVVTNKSFSQNIIKAQFEYNDLVNGYINSDSTIRVLHRNYLKKFNIELATEAFKLLREMEYEKADSLLQSDPKFKNVPERAIALSYIYYYAFKNDLLEMPALSYTDFEVDRNIIVYMSEKKYNKYVKKIDSEIKLKVELIIDLPLTSTKLFKLKE